MGVDEMRAAIQAAPLAALDGIARTIWGAMAAGTLAEADAAALAEAVDGRRAARRHSRTSEQTGPSLGSLRPWSYFPAKRPQRSPDRARSIARRRQLASASPLPPSIAPRFTVGELAALAIIGAEVGQHGACDRSVPEIAARAGVSASTVRNAVREARRLGLLTVEEQRQHRAPNLPNVVRIASAEWLAWIARRPKGGRVQGSKGHGDPLSIERKKDGKDSEWRRYGGRWRQGSGTGKSGKEGPRWASRGSPAAR